MPKQELYIRCYSSSCNCGYLCSCCKFQVTAAAVTVDAATVAVTVDAATIAVTVDSKAALTVDITAALTVMTQHL